MKDPLLESSITTARTKIPNRFRWNAVIITENIYNILGSPAIQSNLDMDL